MHDPHVLPPDLPVPLDDGGSDVAGMRLYKRLTLIARRGVIAKVFYPVFPPRRNASEVLAWLAGR